MHDLKETITHNLDHRSTETLQNVEKSCVRKILLYENLNEDIWTRGLHGTFLFEISLRNTHIIYDTSVVLISAFN